MFNKTIFFFHRTKLFTCYPSLSREMWPYFTQLDRRPPGLSTKQSFGDNSGRKGERRRNQSSPTEFKGGGGGGGAGWVSRNWPPILKLPMSGDRKNITKPWPRGGGGWKYQVNFIVTQPKSSEPPLLEVNYNWYQSIFIISYCPKILLIAWYKNVQRL